MKYLIANDRGRFCFVDMLPSDTGDYYTKVYEAFETKHGKHSWMWKLHDDQKYNGVHYLYDLCRDGMMAVLIQFPWITDNERLEAKRLLYRDHDVVSCRTKKLKQEVSLEMPERKP